MTNWKRIFAKEWLIFLASFVAGAFFLGYAAPFIGNKIMEIQFSMAVKAYQDQIKEYVENNLHDWKPDKISAKEFLDSDPNWVPDKIGASSKKYDPLNLYSFDRWLIVRKFQEVHPEYADWDATMLEKQLPPWVNNYKLPEPVSVPTYYLYYPFRLAILTGLIFYGVVVFIRSTVWAIKYWKKESIKEIK